MNSDGKQQISSPVPSRYGDLRALLRYGVAGVAQNGLFYAVTLFLIWLGLKAWQATAILYPIATAISFAVNRNWSFGDRTHHGATFHKYVFLYVAVYPASIGLNWAQEQAGVSSWLASLITFMVAVVVMFLAMNYWVFRK